MFNTNQYGMTVSNERNKYKSVQFSNGLGTTMTKSRIIERNRYPQNDQLYDPLRNVLNTNPYTINLKHSNHLNAAQASQLSKEYRPLTDRQFQNIRKNTYMIDKPLRPTDHIQKVDGKHFVILNSDEKLQTPINQKLFRSRLEQSREEIVVYQPDDESPLDKVKKIEKVNTNFDDEMYLPNQIYGRGSRSKKTNKYNLYSCLDEPLERVKKNGCINFNGCPENECIADEKERDWFQ